MNMILGEIIIDDTLENNEKIVQSKNKCIVNIKNKINISPNIPSLIIGWDRANKTFNENISILNKKIKENLYWTFSPEEDKQDFNEDIENFIDLLYDDLVKGVKYSIIDPVFEEIFTNEEIINKYFSLRKYDNSYITDDFIYLYEKSEKIIKGIDLRYLKNLNLDTDQIRSSVIEYSKKFDIEDYSDSGIYQKYKKFLNKEIDKKYIPFLINTYLAQIKND